MVHKKMLKMDLVQVIKVYIFKAEAEDDVEIGINTKFIVIMVRIRTYLFWLF